MMERELTIIVCLEKFSAHGWFEEKIQGECRKEHLKIDGQTHFPWDGQALNRIFTNLQVNQKEDACRVLLCTDQELSGPEAQFPNMQNSRAWTLEEIAGAVSGLRAQEWYLNGQALKGRYVKIFPTTYGKGDPVYLYTCPGLVTPEQSESLTPLHQIVQETYCCQ